MKVREIYEHEYDTFSKQLQVEFSIEGDSNDSYRLIILNEDEILESISNPSILEEYDLDELMEDWSFAEDLVEYYIENICEDLPPEEFL